MRLDVQYGLWRCNLEACARPDMHLRDPGYAGFDMHRILKFPNAFFSPSDGTLAISPNRVYEPKPCSLEAAGGSAIWACCRKGKCTDRVGLDAV